MRKTALASILLAACGGSAPDNQPDANDIPVAESNALGRWVVWYELGDCTITDPKSGDDVYSEVQLPTFEIRARLDGTAEVTCETGCTAIDGIVTGHTATVVLEREYELILWTFPETYTLDLSVEVLELGEAGHAFVRYERGADELGDFEPCASEGDARQVSFVGAE